jgi:hypothetical protein
MDREQLRTLARATYRNFGDALAGERIIAQARKIEKVRVVRGSSSHRMQETLLKSNVLCVIDRSFRSADGDNGPGEPFQLQS